MSLLMLVLVLAQMAVVLDVFLRKAVEEGEVERGLAKAGRLFTRGAGAGAAFVAACWDLLCVCSESERESES